MRLTNARNLAVANTQSDFLRGLASSEFDSPASLNVVRGLVKSSGILTASLARACAN
ncbi:MAG: hypothetical protein WAW61_20745 [Methylococcaceae bacterium]